MLTDTGIYFPDSSASVIKFHIAQSVGKLSDIWTYYTDCLLFAESTHQRRIACFQVPYPYDPSFEERVNEIYDHADIILIFASELHARTVSQIRNLDRSKIRWFICGFLNFTMRSPVFNWFDWFTTTVHFYKNVRPSLLSNLDPYTPKPFMFDALLGRKKIHRDFAYQYIQDTLMDKGIVTYGHRDEIDFSDGAQWIWPDDIKQQHIHWTVDRIEYHGHKMSLSQIIPLEVYQRSAYSLVCETNFDNDFVFFTEKTVKPILARRLFVMIGNRFALARLRSIGFRTFQGILDETYDEIEATDQRFLAALEQLKWLCAQDQSQILERCRPILEHNFDLMYGKNWYAEFSGVASRQMLSL